MGKPITFAQDPLAVFLEYQLPQMIAQSKEADKNRMHQENMVQIREESAIRIGEANQKNLQENTLLEFQQDLLKEDYDNTKSAITKQEEELKLLNIIPSQYAKIKDDERSTDSEDIFKIVKSEKGQKLDMTIQQAQTLEENLTNIQNEIGEGKEYQDYLDELLTGAQLGQQVAKEVDDLTMDNIYDIDDFNKYLSLNQVFEKDSPAYQGFMSQAPGYEKSIEIGNQYREGELLMAKTANQQAEAGNREIGRAKNIYGEAIYLDNKGLNRTFQLLSQGYNALEENLMGTDFFENTLHRMEDLKPGEKMDWVSNPDHLLTMRNKLRENMASQLNHSESGIFDLTDDTLDDELDEYNKLEKSGASNDELNEQFDKVYSRLQDINLMKELDFNNSHSANAKAYFRQEMNHYNHATDAYNTLTTSGAMPTGQRTDPMGLGPIATEGSDDLGLSTNPYEEVEKEYSPELEELNSQLALFQNEGLYNDPDYLKLKAEKKDLDAEIQSGKDEIDLGIRLENLQELADLKQMPVEELLAEIEADKKEKEQFAMRQASFIPGRAW